MVLFIYSESLVLTSKTLDMYSMVELTVSGSGFLWHMIRYIVTILQEIGRENEQPSLISQLLDLKKYPSRPQYTLASDTPLCLFDCGYKSEDVEWKVHDYTLKSTVTGLQKTWATYQARSRMMENMLGELTGMAEFSSGDANKGLHEFVQDRPIPSNYIRFENRKMCESLESKKEKMAEKKKNGEESSDKL